MACSTPLRDGPCAMDADHRGRHTVVAFYCDACGKMRRGANPARILYDGNGEPDVGICWFCSNVDNPTRKD